MRSGTFTSIGVLVLVFAALNVFAGEVVERRVFVPSDDRPQGEVRIVRRGDSTVVQTLIHSRVVRRVAGEIARKEQANWPEGREGSDDARSFVDALAEFAKELRDTLPPDEDRRRGFCIEFPASGSVTLSAAVVERRNDGLTLVERREPRVTLELDAAYVARNRGLIVSDAFAVDEQTAREWLASPGT